MPLALYLRTVRSHEGFSLMFSSRSFIYKLLCLGSQLSWFLCVVWGTGLSFLFLLFAYGYPHHHHSLQLCGKSVDHKRKGLFLTLRVFLLICLSLRHDHTVLIIVAYNKKRGGIRPQSSLLCWLFWIFCISICVLGSAHLQNGLLGFLLVLCWIYRSVLGASHLNNI